jgi:hypothetical protein
VAGRGDRVGEKIRAHVLYIHIPCIYMVCILFVWKTAVKEGYRRSLNR